MKFLKFITSFLLIYEIPFYLIKGQTITKEKTDCTNLNNFLNNDSKYYDNSCCSNGDIECDNEGYITSLSILPRYNIINKSNNLYLNLYKLN